MPAYRPRIDLKIATPLVAAIVLIYAFSGHADDTTETPDFLCEIPGNCDPASGHKVEEDPSWKADIHIIDLLVSKPTERLEQELMMASRTQIKATDVNDPPKTDAQQVETQKPVKPAQPAWLCAPRPV